MTGMICLLTAAMYMGSAVYSPSIPGIMVEFGVSEVAAVSGLSLFVFAYGISPLLLTSLQGSSVCFLISISTKFNLPFYK